MLNKAFTLICDKVEEVLKERGFVKAKIDSDNDNEMVSLYTSENIAYSVVYYKDIMHMVMRECGMTDEGPDNNWRTMATWMFDPASDTLKEANSIAGDFVEALSTDKAVKRVKQARKTSAKKSGDEGNADPIFLSKRFVQFFPELKDEIKNEEDCYYPFRGVTFAREHIVPRVNELVKRASASELKKLGGIFSAQYANGDVDTRSIITIVLINSIPEEYDAKIDEYLSDDLKKAAAASRKLRGKVVKPEKEKKPKKTFAQRLGQ